KLGDDFGDGPDHGGQVALLPGLAVHRQPDLTCARVADLIDAVNGRHGGGEVEPLGGVPRAAILLGQRLQVAPGQVVADGVAVDVAFSVFNRNVAPAFADGDDQLHLVMQVAGAGRI